MFNAHVHTYSTDPKAYDLCPYVDCDVFNIVDGNRLKLCGRQNSENRSAISRSSSQIVKNKKMINKNHEFSIISCLYGREVFSYIRCPISGHRTLESRSRVTPKLAHLNQIHVEGACDWALRRCLVSAA